MSVRALGALLVPLVGCAAITAHRPDPRAVGEPSCSTGRGAAVADVALAFATGLAAGGVAGDSGGAAMLLGVTSLVFSGSAVYGGQVAGACGEAHARYAASRRPDAIADDADDDRPTGGARPGGDHDGGQAADAAARQAAVTAAAAKLPPAPRPEPTAATDDAATDDAATDDAATDDAATEAPTPAFATDASEPSPTPPAPPAPRRPAPDTWTDFWRFP